jgi:hypothetical protein
LGIAAVCFDGINRFNVKEFSAVIVGANIAPP